MLYEWCYFNKYFTEEKCDSILDTVLKYPSINGTIGTPEGFQEVETTRRSKVRFVQKDDSRFTWLFDDLWKLADLCNKSYFNFDINVLDFIQIAEYNSENLGSYYRHLDTIWINPDRPYHRKLSCTVQLSSHDSYDGGEFEFYDLQYKTPDSKNKLEMKERGTAIFFPSFIQHGVMPVTKGIRYSITAWFEGPKWR